MALGEPMRGRAGHMHSKRPSQYSLAHWTLLVRNLTILAAFNDVFQTCVPCQHRCAVVTCRIVNPCTR